VFERGTYTACEPCKEHPEKPPLWQVKAARIIHDNSEHTIYYEDATLEIAGIPVAYLPYFWTPDPTEKRRTGFLAPRYVASTTLGYGVALPFFWAPAPNYDLTLTPTFLSRQGFLVEAEWRHRLATGEYSIRAAGIFQQDPSAFLPAPLGPGDGTFRGSIESTGRFNINEHWRWGWDAALLSDKWFLQNYRIPSESVVSDFKGFSESISTAYLQGQGDRSWFDLRGYYFQGLSTYDWQKQQPVAAPVLDYDKRINGPAPIGGEVQVTANFTSLTREAAQFQATSTALKTYLFPDTAYAGLYETCSVFAKSECLLRGMSGTDTRASAQVSWRRTFIDPLGQSWTPFAYARADGFWIMPNLNGYQNSELPNFLSGSDQVAGRFMPAVGLEYRYPFIGTLGSWGTQQVEPIAQIIARPDETQIGQLPNEDAQSVVFDDTSIFDWDKFSGYDRVEGGVRANLGAKYAITGANGFYADALIGQSIQVAGQNSYAVGDLVNAGLDSGLDSTRSDYVARLLIQPNRNFSLTTRARFDPNDFTQQALEVGFTGKFAPLLPLTTSVTYASYAAQPDLGYDRREGLLTSAKLNLTPNWSLTGSTLFDLSRSSDIFVSAALGGSSATNSKSQSAWDPASLGVGISYDDECMSFGIAYSVKPNDTPVSGTTSTTNQTVLLKLEFKTLGQINAKQNLSSSALQDGISGK
jgi:LPS-assembly protein